MQNVGIVPAYKVPAKRDLIFFDSFLATSEHVSRSSERQMPTKYGMLHFAPSVESQRMEADVECRRSAGILDVEANSLEDLLAQAESKEVSVDEIREYTRFLHESIHSQPHFGHGYRPPMDSGVEPHIWLKAIERLAEYESHALARLASLLKSDASTAFTPIIQSRTFPSLVPSKVEDILQVALKAFPVPTDDVSFQEIIEFKRDAKVQEHLQLMRRWIRKTLANDKATAAQVGEENADTLFDFTQCMRLAKMKYQTEVVQVLVTFIPATIERICKLQFSQVFDPFFALRKARIGLLEAELKAPGRELAYLHRSLAQFGAPQG